MKVLAMYSSCIPRACKYRQTQLGAQTGRGGEWNIILSETQEYSNHRGKKVINGFDFV
jgi:hypothetical protein